MSDEAEPDPSDADVCVHDNLRKMRVDFDQHAPSRLPWAVGTVAPELYDLVRNETIARGSVLVDLGCGQGTEAVFFAMHGMDVVGIDALPGALRMAKELADHYGVKPRWIRGSIFQVPLPDASADVTLDSFVFHHLIDDVRDRYAREVHRVLRPGGLFVLRGYSDRMPPGDGPRRLGSEEILATFMPYFTCERLEPIRGVQAARSPVEHPQAPWYWLAHFRRKPNHADVAVRRDSSR